MLIRIRDFKGEAPRRADKLLGENAATVAKNVDLRSGRLLPWRDMLRMDTPTKVGTILSLYRWNSRAGTDKSGKITAATKAVPCAITVQDDHGMVNGDRVYLYRVAGMTQINGIVFTVTVTSAKAFTLDGVDSSAYGAYTDNGIWVLENGRFFHWLTDVDVARSHIGQETNERTVFTGDGAPKVTDSTLATGGTDYPVNDYDLGLPAPINKINIQGIDIIRDMEALSPATVPPSNSNFNKIIYIKTTDHGLDRGDIVFFQSAPNVEYLTGNSYTVIMPGSSILGASTTNPVVITVSKDLPLKNDQEIVQFFEDGERVSIQDVVGMTAVNGDHVMSNISKTITAMQGYIVIFKYPETWFTDITSANHGLVAGDRVLVEGEYLFGTSTGGQGLIAKDTYITTVLSVSSVNVFRLRGIYVYQAGAYFLNARKFTIPVDGSLLPLYESGGFWDMSDWFGLEGTEGIRLGGTITSVTLGNPTVVNSIGHRLLDGEIVYIRGVVDRNEISGLPSWHPGSVFSITRIDNDSFSLDNIDSTATGALTYVGAFWEKAYVGGGTWSKYFAKNDFTSKAYFYTYVSGWGEEGPPSPASNVVDVGNGQDVRVANLSVAPPGSFNVVTKRIYRVLSSTAGETYRLVAEIPVANPTYTDDVKDKDLGEEIPSETWIQPPATMHSVRTMDNGIMVGVNGNDVHFSEPFLPHAWPDEYRQAAPHNIITVGAFGNTVVVLTESGPVLYQGSSPASISSTNLKVAQVCVAKRALVELGSYGIIYPSPDGLISLSVSGLNIITKEHMTNKEWQSYNPSSMHAYLWDDRYVCFYTKLDGTQGGFIFDQKQPDIGLTFISTYATAGYNDPIADTLFLQIGDNIEAWAKGDSKMTYLWKSKIFEGKRQAKYSCGQIIADDYLDVNINVYKDGVLHHTRNVLNNKPFRIYTKTKGREWQIEIFGTSAVTTVAIAETLRELGEV